MIYIYIHISSNLDVGRRGGTEFSDDPSDFMQMLAELKPHRIDHFGQGLVLKVLEERQVTFTMGPWGIGENGT